jgi:hypothetical protein
LRDCVTAALLAIDDPVFMHRGIRDAYSRLTYRECQAIESWLERGLPLHTIRDRPGHKLPVILSGFDGHRAAIYDLAAHIDSWRARDGDKYWSDEALIAERLWPAPATRRWSAPSSVIVMVTVE